jgi:carboxyl-terminal processing protease
MRTLRPLAILLLTGLIVGPVVAAVEPAKGPGLSPSNLALIVGVMELVRRDYIRPVGPDQLTTDVLKGMLSRLDPHSDYMDEQEYKEVQGTISGKFGGLGIEITVQNGVPRIISPIAGTPAAQAGLQPGDLIASINGESTLGMSIEKVVNLLRGTPGSTVKVGISRGDKPPFDVTLTRRIIQVHTVKSQLEPDGIGYIRITEFAEETARDLKQAIDKLQQQAGGRLEGVVLDLRDDPGGLVSSAVAVTGNFVNGGKVVTIRGRHHSDDETYKATAASALLTETPMVVLINGASASASEIVAGALQDRHRATVMGTQSFGKGSVQTIIPIQGHGALRLTTALYYTPDGRSIQDDGISPDIVVEAPKEQQVAGASLVRESALHGAFKNPGPLGSAAGAKLAASAAGADESPPIREELIGTADDAQLKAALSHLAKGRTQSQRTAPSSSAK